MRPLLVTFVGGETGPWVVERLDTVAGTPLDGASRLDVIEGRQGDGSTGGRRGPCTASPATNATSRGSSTRP
jgi:hypothetical protein